MLASCANAALVGLVDLDLMLARKVIDDEALTGVVVGSSLEEVAGRTDAGAVINVTVPQAHRVVNETALRAGLHVLCEKPLGLTLGDALRQVALADLTRGLLMVSQSRRYFNNLSALRDAVQQLGALGTITTEFFHCDHEPGFREQMAQPLLFDMSIHHFDALRFVTGEEANAVRCSAWNPPWSWYAGAASATAEFELSSGARYVYAGSRCTPGLPTSWNGTWHVHAELGAAHWDGDHPPEIDAEGVTVAVPAGEEHHAAE
jgi:predicted dehydrogenase